MMRTYQTRLKVEEDAEASLSAYASRYSRGERVLFRLFGAGAGKDPGQIKSWFMEAFSITARQFNAMAASVKGKISSLMESRKFQIKDLEERIPKLESQLKEKLKPGTAKYHNKKRKLASLRNRLEALKKDQEAKSSQDVFWRPEAFPRAIQP